MVSELPPSPSAPGTGVWYIRGPQLRPGPRRPRPHPPAEPGHVPGHVPPIGNETRPRGGVLGPLRPARRPAVKTCPRRVRSRLTACLAPAGIWSAASREGGPFPSRQPGNSATGTPSDLRPLRPPHTHAAVRLPPLIAPLVGRAGLRHPLDLGQAVAQHGGAIPGRAGTRSADGGADRPSETRTGRLPTHAGRRRRDNRCAATLVGAVPGRRWYGPCPLPAVPPRQPAPRCGGCSQRN